MAKKPTRWASSSQHMLARLSRRCQQNHQHQHLDGGRTRDAAFYPPDLVLEILRGIRDTTDAEMGVEEEPEEQQPELVHALNRVPGVCVPSEGHSCVREFADIDDKKQITLYVKIMKLMSEVFECEW